MCVNEIAVWTKRLVKSNVLQTIVGPDCSRLLEHGLEKSTTTIWSNCLYWSAVTARAATTARKDAFINISLVFLFLFGLNSVPQRSPSKIHEGCNTRSATSPGSIPPQCAFHTSPFQPLSIPPQKVPIVLELHQHVLRKSYEMIRDQAPTTPLIPFWFLIWVVLKLPKSGFISKAACVQEANSHFFFSFGGGYLLSAVNHSASGHF